MLKVSNLVQKTQLLLRESGKTSVLQTCPVKNLDFAGLIYVPKLSEDVYSFRGDRTLCPAFLDDLMKLDDADTIKFVTNVKDRILQVRGFSHPEKMKIAVMEHDLYNMAFDFASGELSVANLGSFSKEQKIALLMHEIDHFEKGACLYKALGAEKYEKALRKRFPNSFLFINNKFWSEMSQNVDIQGFDVKKYLGSWKHSKDLPIRNNKDFNIIRNTHFYATDAFEAAAYEKQKMVLRALGQNDKVYADACGEPLGKIISRLDELDIPDEKKYEIFSELSDASIYLLSEDALLLMKNYKSIKSGIMDYNVLVALNALHNAYDDVVLFHSMKNVENWINQGCYSIDDILAKGLV